MSSTYSAQKIQLMATGENPTTWGDITNTNLIALQDMTVASGTVTFASADITLTLTDSNATQVARAFRLNLTGTSGGARNLIVPAGQKPYLIKNGVADAVTIKNATGTGVTVAAGATAFVYNDGTNVTTAAAASGANSDITSLAGLTTPLTVAQGGIGVGTLTGLAKGAGTSAFTAATAGSDYVSPTVATTFTAKQTFAPTTTPGIKIQNVLEKVTISATAATGTIQYDVLTQSILYYTTSASANWTLNIRGNSTTSLDSIMATGECITVVFKVTNGATAYYQSAFTVDGTSVTPKWQDGIAPTAGSASAVDFYTITVTKTGAAAFSADAAFTKFA